MSGHTVQAAMDRGELTEEEAYFVLRFAGRHGYAATMRALMRAFGPDDAADAAALVDQLDRDVARIRAALAAAR